MHACTPRGCIYEQRSFTTRYGQAWLYVTYDCTQSIVGKLFLLCDFIYHIFCYKTFVKLEFFCHGSDDFARLV